MTRCYHADLGIPDDIADPVAGVALTYTLHAHTAAVQDRVRLPAALPLYTLVEVEATRDNAPLKWVVRCALDTTRDLVLAITSTYLVKTVWVNDCRDDHATLDRTRYDRPEKKRRFLV